MEPQDVQAPVGSSVQISCSAEGSPKPTIEWTRKSDEGETIGFPQSDLQFSFLSQNDSGTYECRARNNLDKDLVRKIKLDVLGKYK